MPINRAVIYTRVSTEAQATGVSLQLQKEVCQAFATAKGMVVSKTYKEVGSAYRGDQPQLKRLLSKIKPGTTLLVYAMDRLTRNLDVGHYVLGKLYTKKCPLVSVRGEPNQVEAIRLAQAEAETLSKRMSDRVAFMRKQGSHIGPAPYGSSVVEVKNKKLTKTTTIRRLIDDDQEQAVIELISLMRNENTPNSDIISQVQLVKGPDYDTRNMDIGDAGVCNYTTIAQFLNDLQIWYRGKLWTPQKVSKVYKSIF